MFINKSLSIVYVCCVLMSCLRSCTPSYFQLSLNIAVGKNGKTVLLPSPYEKAGFLGKDHSAEKKQEKWKTINLQELSRAVEDRTLCKNNHTHKHMLNMEID